MAEFKNYNHSLIQLAFSVLTLLFACIACTPDNSNKNDGDGGSQNNPEEQTIPAGAVDLGIVMKREDGTTYKLFWAKSNLSTSGLCANPEDYGDYYAWGETEPKEDYYWEEYKWYRWSTSTTLLTKYNADSSHGAVDNKTVLEPEDDAASVNLGGKWRMPTDAEWTELLDQCTWTWTDNYNGTGIAGRIVTSKVEGYTGKSIFFPAAGRREYTYLFDDGSYGIYWSSSLSTDFSPGAWRVIFYSGKVSLDDTYRNIGFSVRPVSE